MSTTFTDSEFLYRAAFKPGAMGPFLDDPDSMTNVLRFTPRDEVRIYDAVNPDVCMDLHQEGKVVVVTGAGRGIGQATAITFAKARIRVLGICSRTTTELESTRQAILAISPNTRVVCQAVDVSEEDQVRSFFDTMKSEFGRVDVTISNAGANSCFDVIASTETDLWWRDVTVNLKGTYLVAKYFVQQLGGQSGTLINISSCHALAAVPGQSAYCSSKIAAARILEIIHLESPNVRCFSVHPGAVDTVLLHELQRKMGGLELKWRWTEPALTGATALWLTTPRADFLRGRWLSVNWRIDELEAEEGGIVEHNMLKLAFSAGLGAS